MNAIAGASLVVCSSGSESHGEVVWTKLETKGAYLKMPFRKKYFIHLNYRWRWGEKGVEASDHPSRRFG